MKQICRRNSAQVKQGLRTDFGAIVTAAVPEGSVEVWFQDEARAEQKDVLNRLWAWTSSRLKIVCDHRYGYGYLLGAACPRHNPAVDPVCDRTNPEEMNRHLRDISEATSSGAHTVLILDGAGWY